MPQDRFLNRSRPTIVQQMLRLTADRGGVHSPQRRCAPQTGSRNVIESPVRQPVSHVVKQQVGKWMNYSVIRESQLCELNIGPSPSIRPAGLFAGAHSVLKTAYPVSNWACSLVVRVRHG
jgi:hypothetical protein